MQQTEKYQLNLIEKTDPFAPEALNQSTQKVEEVLAAETAALDARVTVVEAKKVVTGSYTGDGAAERAFDLGFAPKAIIFSHYQAVTSTSITLHLLTPDNPISGVGGVITLELTENGFVTRNFMGSPMNEANSTYYFLALA